MFFTTPLFGLLLASAALAQSNTPIVYDSFHNTTPIVGTWSTGSQAVVTGAGFANPANLSFTYPKTTGESYSFTEDGFYEIARYRFNGNGSQPTCITGVINWCHGTYSLNPNGSITMTPLGDGYQQVQDPCAAVSNFVQNYNDTEYYQSWQIFTDPVAGYKLHLFMFDGTPVAPQFQVSLTPNMLPPQALRTVAKPVTTTTSNGYTTPQNDLVQSAARRAWGGHGMVVGATTIVGLAVASSLFL